MHKPILVLQPRRLGDLILSFPLLVALNRLYPASPVWVMAQKRFYEPLLPFAPKVAFIAPEQLADIASLSYEAIINLGPDPESARFTGERAANLKLGRLATGDRLSVNGYWQLYRESLTQNNRHNIFHWADLFGLDLPTPPLRPLALPKGAGSGRIGLFVGASEPSKRPRAQFWADLANRLAAGGAKPVLLGGQDDVAMGASILACGAKAANFCGKTSLAQLAGMLKSLDLLITPDTGPMHFADLLSVPVLNLSMGNVHAAETGPVSPGQHVLRAAMSCVGCWQCSRESLYCREIFDGRRVARLALDLVDGKKNVAAPPGLELLKTDRDDLGLYRLNGKTTSRRLLEAFWQAAFLRFYDISHQSRLETAAGALLARNPAVATHIRANLGKSLACVSKSGRNGKVPPDSFWLAQPGHSRLFTGFLQMSLQNSGFSARSFGEALERIDLIQAVLAGAN